MMKVGLRTRFLEEPVDLALTDPVVLGTVEQSEPVHNTGRVRARIEEIEGKQMGLGPKTQTPLRSCNKVGETKGTYASALFTLRT